MGIDLTIHDDGAPLRKDAAGAIRVGQTRMLFYLVVEAFKAGDDPEHIVRSYTTLNLADTYSVIGYYLRHQAEVDQYLHDLYAEAEEARKQAEADRRRRGLPDLKALLQERRTKTQSQNPVARGPGLEPPDASAPRPEPQRYIDL